MRSLPTTIAILALLSVSPVLAQTTTTGQPATGGASSGQSGGQQAVTRPNTDHADPARGAATVPAASLERGANSFTEGEVKGRLERTGFSDVKDLKKDDQGIWRGHAMQNGKSVQIGFDFKGNVAIQ